MSTPASVHQASKFVRDALGDPSSDRMQYLLANSSLFRELARADFSKIDRAAFTASLTPNPTPFAWRPVGEYAERISQWNNMRNWGLSGVQISTLANSIVDHLDPLHPTGIDLWLGRNLAYNWREAMICLQTEVEAIGEKFVPYIDGDRIKFLSGSEQAGQPSLGVALLTIDDGSSSEHGVVPDEVRETGDRFPGLEVAWLLALNPHAYRAIGAKAVPGLLAPGLTVDTGCVPAFAGDSKGTYVGGAWSYRRCVGFAAVCFRE